MTVASAVPDASDHRSRRLEVPGMGRDDLLELSDPTSTTPLPLSPATPPKPMLPALEGGLPCV